PWNAPKPFEPRLGEYYLYDEFDPQRAILFLPNGEKWRCTSFSNSGHTCTGTNSATPPVGNQYFLNFNADDATARPVVGCGARANNGSCLQPNVTQENDGYGRLFGDLANDWARGVG